MTKKICFLEWPSLLSYGNQLKVILNFLQNEKESKRAEFKTPAVIFVDYLLAQRRTLNY